jgi:imidazole glycerol phosphate synthase subunit HisF
MAMPLKRKRLLVGKGKFTVSFDGAALYGAALIVIISVKFKNQCIILFIA